MPDFAKTPEPPYVAVIFSSLRSEEDESGYAKTAGRMEELASLQPGFLGIESARGADGFGISVSYWRDIKSAQEWKHHAEHRIARERGRRTWYRDYTARIAIVERDYGNPPA